MSLAAQTDGIISHDSFDSCAPEGESCLYESCPGIELSVPCKVVALTVDNAAGLLMSQLARCCLGSESLGQLLRSYSILGVGFGR